MSELKYEDLKEVVKNADSSLVQLLALQLMKTMAQIDKLEIDEGKLIDERDSAEAALGDMYEKVLGYKPEWSNFYGYADAVDDVEEMISVLRVVRGGQ